VGAGGGTGMGRNRKEEEEKCHNSDMRLSFLGIDCTDFIQTGHNRKLILYKLILYNSHYIRKMPLDF